MADEARASSEETGSNASGSGQGDPGFLTGRWFKSNRGSHGPLYSSARDFFDTNKSDTLILEGTEPDCLRCKEEGGRGCGATQRIKSQR